MSDFSVLSQKTGIPKSCFDEVAAVGIHVAVCCATTVDEARQEYQKASEGSDEKRAAFERWSGLSLYEIEEADNLKAIKDACRRAPHHSEVERLGHIKWVRLCETLDDVYDVYRICHPGSHVEKRALARMIEIHTGGAT